MVKKRPKGGELQLNELTNLLVIQWKPQYYYHNLL